MQRTSEISTLIQPAEIKTPEDAMRILKLDNDDWSVKYRLPSIFEILQKNNLVSPDVIAKIMAMVQMGKIHKHKPLEQFADIVRAWDHNKCLNEKTLNLLLEYQFVFLSDNALQSDDFFYKPCLDAKTADQIAELLPKYKSLNLASKIFIELEQFKKQNEAKSGDICQFLRDQLTKLKQRGDISAAEFQTIVNQLLHKLVIFDDTQLIQVLLDHKADINYKLGQDSIWITLAENGGTRKMANYLFDRSGISLPKEKFVGWFGDPSNPLESMNNDCLTPLHCAVRTGNSELADFLLSKKVSTQRIDRWNLTPLGHLSHGFLPPDNPKSIKAAVAMVAVFQKHKGKSDRCFDDAFLQLIKERAFSFEAAMILFKYCTISPETVNTALEDLGRKGRFGNEGLFLVGLLFYFRDKLDADSIEQLNKVLTPYLNLFGDIGRENNSLTHPIRFFDLTICLQLYGNLSRPRDIEACYDRVRSILNEYLETGKTHQLDLFGEKQTLTPDDMSAAMSIAAMHNDNDLLEKLLGRLQGNEIGVVEQAISKIANHCDKWRPGYVSSCPLPYSPFTGLFSLLEKVAVIPPQIDRFIRLRREEAATQRLDAMIFKRQFKSVTAIVSQEKKAIDGIAKKLPSIPSQSQGQLVDKFTSVLTTPGHFENKQASAQDKNELLNLWNDIKSLLANKAQQQQGRKLLAHFLILLNGINYNNINNAVAKIIAGIQLFPANRTDSVNQSFKKLLTLPTDYDMKFESEESYFSHCLVHSNDLFAKRQQFLWFLEKNPMDRRFFCEAFMASRLSCTDKYDEIQQLVDQHKGHKGHQQNNVFGVSCGQASLPDSEWQLRSPPGMRYE